MPVFSKNGRHFFSRARMDTRVGAFESPMFRLHAVFFFIDIALLEKILQRNEIQVRPLFRQTVELKLMKRASQLLFCKTCNGSPQWNILDVSSLTMGWKDSLLTFVGKRAH